MSCQQKIVVECLDTLRAEGCFINQIGATLKDDLVNTVSLGEDIKLLGRLSRSEPIPGKTQESYMHDIDIEVNNVIRIGAPNSASNLMHVPGHISKILNSNMSAWNTSQAIVDLVGKTQTLVVSSSYIATKVVVNLGEI
ncbi:hypothetical protein BGX28_009457 [Mortierella sp. GBA30]|nr:hypothetical protein BGX28_009457 [Mortierella sp. GBA30]